jgi:tetratricopeptide (TPR) repeat protein
VPSPRDLLAAAIAALLLPSVALPAGSFKCPAKGGPEWREYASEHVVLRTDLAPDEAREMVREVELARAGVLHGLFARPPQIPSILQVVAFANKDDYETMSPRYAVAYYTAIDGLTPMVVLPGTLGPRTRAILVHELAHHLSSFPLLRMPMWLSEGLAVYLESIGATGLRTRMTVGTVPDGRRILKGGRIQVSDLLEWHGIDPSWSNDRGVRYYESSWLLVHYLVNVRPDAFADFLRRMGRAEDPKLAWKAAFPKWDPARPEALEDLEGELDDYARHGKVQFRTLDLQVSPKIAERTLPSSEVHVLRALLLPRGGEKRIEVLRAEIDEALAEDPGAAAPVAVLARIDPKADRLPLARSATKAHPEDWRAWSALAAALPSDARTERLEALRKSLALAQGQPLPLLELAAELADTGMAEEAAPYALQLVRVAPYSPVSHEMLAQVAISLGRCADAVRSQQRALDTLPDGTSAATRDSEERKLAAYQRMCVADP